MRRAAYVPDAQRAAALRQEVAAEGELAGEIQVARAVLDDRQRPLRAACGVRHVGDGIPLPRLTSERQALLADAKPPDPLPGKRFAVRGDKAPESADGDRAAVHERRIRAEIGQGGLGNVAPAENGVRHGVHAVRAVAHVPVKV